MKPSSFEKLSAKATPACITLLAFLLTAALSRFGGNWQMMPDFTLINLFFWSLFIEGALPYWFVFMLGLLQDSINGTPFGMTAFINMILVWLVSQQLRVIANMSFFFIWGVFIGFAIVSYALQWLLTMLYYMHIFSFNSNMLAFAFLCCVYPVCHIILTLLWQKTSNR